MIELLTSVKVGVPNGQVVEWRPAVLVGRTIEQKEKVRYDVRLENGEVLSGIPYLLVEAA